MLKSSVRWIPIECKLHRIRQGFCTSKTWGSWIAWEFPCGCEGYVREIEDVHKDICAVFFVNPLLSMARKIYVN